MFTMPTLFRLGLECDSSNIAKQPTLRAGTSIKAHCPLQARLTETGLGPYTLISEIEQ